MNLWFFLWDDIVENHTEAFLTNLKRHGLIFFRVAMILSAVRNSENLPDMEHLECNESDFDIAMELTKTMLRHSQKIFDSLDNGFLSAQDEELLDGLNLVFQRSEILQKGKELGIPQRTVDDKLAKWQQKKIIRRVKKGEYKILL